MKHTAWLWPDHNIGKRESRRLREEHNALYNSHAELLGALEGLAKETNLSKLNVRRDFSLMNAHAYATKAILKAKGE